MSAADILKTLEADAWADYKHYHVRAHAVQFVGLFAAGFFVALAKAGWHVDGWDALAGLALGAAGAAIRQMFPQLPWTAFLTLVRDAQDAHPAPPPAAAAPAAPSPPGAG